MSEEEESSSKSPNPFGVAALAATAFANGRRKRKLASAVFKGALEDLKNDPENIIWSGKQHTLSREVSRVAKHSELGNDRQLLEIFIEVDDEWDEDDQIDTEKISELVGKGACINARDIYGQTILHAIAREWNPDIAKFVIHLGADVNTVDYFGRAPIHLAAANDFVEMIHFLVSQGADVNMPVVHNLKLCNQLDPECAPQNQTPLHMAAGADAADACEALLELKADIEARDFHDRTPLFLAAELDRSVSAHVLLEHGADATTRDKFGNICLTIMASKMPQVASEALNQLWTYNRRNRNQYFWLDKLLPSSAELVRASRARNILEVIVKERKLDLVTHNIIQKFIDILWAKYGQMAFYREALLTFVFIGLWTTIAVCKAADEAYIYEDDEWWRWLLLVLAIICTGLVILSEIREYRTGKNRLAEYKSWRVVQIQEDAKYSHPMRKHESKFIEAELESVEAEKAYYFSSGWNYYDWFCYFLLLLALSIHSVTVGIFNSREITVENNDPAVPLDNEALPNSTTCFDRLLPDDCDLVISINKVHYSLFAFTMVVLYARAFKLMRVTLFMGPFIVIIQKMMWDLLKFCAMWLVLYAGYAIAFYLVWGHSVQQEEILSDTDEMLFMLYRLILVDEWPYDAMMETNKIMTYILVGSYLMFCAILLLNLFIALLSDTFQRIYDNAHSNAVMQRAIYLKEHLHEFSDEEKIKLSKYFETKCSPLREDWDDDSPETEQTQLKKITHQIHEKLTKLEEFIEEQAEALEKGDRNRSAPTKMPRGYGAVTPLDVEGLKQSISRQMKEFTKKQNEALERLESFESSMRGRLDKIDKRQKIRIEKGAKSELKSTFLPPMIPTQQTVQTITQVEKITPKIDTWNVLPSVDNPTIAKSSTAENNEESEA